MAWTSVTQPIISFTHRHCLFLRMNPWRCCFSAFIQSIKCSILDILLCSLFPLFHSSDIIIWCRQLTHCHVDIRHGHASMLFCFTFLCQSIVLLCPMPCYKVSPWWAWSRNTALSSAVWVFHIKQAQAAAANASRSCSTLLLTHRPARMPFLNLYSYVFQPVLHYCAGAGTVTGSSQQRW